jgi:hypothetical protein
VGGEGMAYAASPIWQRPPAARPAASRAAGPSRPHGGGAPRRNADPRSGRARERHIAMPIALERSDTCATARRGGRRRRTPRPDPTHGAS